MFDATKEDLKDILLKAHKGALQLPDFQRDYVWEDADVQSLIASIAKGFPVGALLTLETGGEVEFMPRVIEGAPKGEDKPHELLLDGQQRITSIYQSLFSPEPIKTRNQKNKEIDRYYYINITKAISGIEDLEEAIIGTPADRQVKTNFGRDVVLDLSSPDKEFKNDMFPLNKSFDSRDWFYDWRDYWSDSDKDVRSIEKEFVRNVLEKIERYEMPIIRLGKANSRAAICLVFEKVNVGGKKLDAFELLTAIYAASKYDLRKDWRGDENEVGRLARIIGSPFPRDVVTQIASTDFLQACTLLHTREKRIEREQLGYKDKELPQISCNKDALLALPLEAYKKHQDLLEEGFIETAGFLNELKIIWHKDIPYPPLLIALASVFAILGKEAKTETAKQKLRQWFWSVTLGELYGSSTESRLARDVPELVEWIKGVGSKPRSLDEAIFQQERLNSLRQRLSAAYKGVHTLLMHQGCKDFITGREVEIMTFFNDKIDIHHIFPRDWCKKQGIKPAVFNSIVNKTPLFKTTNIVIGGVAPSEYLKAIEKKQGISSETLDELLRSHLIEPEHLRSDDFLAFYKARTAALSGLISEAMDKPVVEQTGTNEVEREIATLSDENPTSEAE
jgi:hypothetical protein